MNDLSKYRLLRPGMHTGDLLTYRTEGVISSLIHLWSPDNHAGLILDLPEYEGSEECRKWTLEAVASGPRVAYLSRLLEKVHGEVYWHALRPEYNSARQAIGCFALEQAGVTKYDIPSLFKNIFGRVSADLNKLFCSEYVFLAWKHAGIVTGDIAPRPSELADLGVTYPPVLIVQSKPTQPHPPLEP